MMEMRDGEREVSEKRGETDANDARRELNVNPKLERTHNSLSSKDSSCVCCRGLLVGWKLRLLREREGRIARLVCEQGEAGDEKRALFTEQVELSMD